MCGICGIYNLSGVAVEIDSLRRMSDTLSHRGPDGEGYFINAGNLGSGEAGKSGDEETAEFLNSTFKTQHSELISLGVGRGNVVLGHRRLSIIDLAAGKQPLCNEDGNIWITFNGEIYNYLELKRELENRGHRFRTRSDTETIVHAYEEWGEDAVKKLNGMFAFAIWDSVKQKLFLAKDRVGKKPLYWSQNGSEFGFASEIKALLAGGDIKRDINPRALDAYLCFGYVPAPLTIFCNIYKLKPAHTLTVTRNGIRETQYWNLSFAEYGRLGLYEAVDEFESLLDEAVKCRLMSEVPLGAFLSGGLDSTLVVSSIVGSSHDTVLTNSIGFNENEYSELPLARIVADHLKTNHHEFIVEPHVLDVLDKIAWHFDEPFADSSAVPTWYVCEMARRNVTVALSGDGGDEGFGGYTFRYIPHMIESRVRNLFPNWFRSLIFGRIGACYPPSAKLPRPLRLKTYFENLAVSDAEAFYLDLSWLRSSARARLYSAKFKKQLAGFDSKSFPISKYVGSDSPNALGRSQHTDIQLYMTDDVLVKVDRMSMAHSLEVRSPLLDHRILEFASRLPVSLKIHHRQGKVLLRHLAKKRLPKKILEQPKRGFSIPAAEWLRTDLCPMVEKKVLKKGQLITDYLNHAELLKMWQEHKSGARDHNVFFWGLLMLSLWSEHYY